MQIEKAYLFARQITEGEVPQPMEPDVYFENGRFNPLYVPQGFNFNNNKHKIVDQYVYLPDYDFQQGYLEDGSVIQMQIGDGENPSEDDVCFLGSDGYLHIYHNPAVESSEDQRNYQLHLLLPIINISEISQSYNYILFEYRCLTGRSDTFEIDMMGFTKDTQTRFSSYYYDGYTVADVPMEEWDINTACRTDEGEFVPDFLDFITDVYEPKNEPFDYDLQIRKIYFGSY